MAGEPKTGDWDEATKEVIAYLKRLLPNTEPPAKLRVRGVFSPSQPAPGQPPHDGPTMIPLTVRPVQGPSPALSRPVHTPITVKPAIPAMPTPHPPKGDRTATTGRLDNGGSGYPRAKPQAHPAGPQLHAPVAPPPIAPEASEALLMPPAALGTLLKLARHGPVSCAIGLTTDRIGVLLLSRLHKPRQVMGRLRKEAAAANLDLNRASLRFGRATVDSATDNALVHFIVNKESPDLLRLKLRERLLPAGFQRCLITVDASLEQEPDEGPADDPRASGTPPDGKAAASPVEVALRARLTQLAQRASTAIKTTQDPRIAQAIRDEAAKARAALDSKNFAAATAAAEQMDYLIGIATIPAGPPPPTTPAPTPRAAQMAAPVSPERASAIDGFARDNSETRFWSSQNGAERIGDALQGRSPLGAVDAPEQDRLLKGAMGVWEGKTDSRMVESLADQARTSGARKVVMQNYADRAVSLAPDAIGHEGEVSRPRTMAEAYVSGTVRASPDAAALRDRITSLGEQGAGRFGDIQAMGGIPTGDGQEDLTGLTRTLDAMNGGPETDASRSYATHVLASANDYTFRRVSVSEYGSTDLGPSAAAAPLTTQMTRLVHPNDPAGQTALAARLAPIMQSEAGAKLFAPDFSQSIFGATRAERQASEAARFQALDAIARNKAITVQDLGDDPWTNKALVQAIAEPSAAREMAAFGDKSFVMRGSDLDNYIGFSMHLPPKIPGNETPDQAAAREQATAEGKCSYYDQEPVRLIRDAIRNAAAETGGDPDAPAVAHLPITISNGSTGPVELPLYRIDGPNGSQFVDNQGHKFKSFDDWQKRNTLPEGTMSVPTGGRLTRGPDGKPLLSTSDTPETHNTAHHIEKGLDKVALVGGTVAAGAMVIGTGGAAAPVVAYAAGVYMAGRGAQELYETKSRGGSIDPLKSSEARGEWLQVVAGSLSAAAPVAKPFAQWAGGSATLSRGMASGVAGVRVATAVADTAAMANQGHDLAVNWQQMTPEQRLLAGLNAAFWGLGASRQGSRPFDFAGQREAVLAETRPPRQMDPNMPGDYVGIHREGGKPGDLGRTRVIHGSGASDADIALHEEQNTVLAAYSGIEGRIRNLLSRSGAKGTPGTRAFTVNAEIQKIGLYAREAEARLNSGRLTTDQTRMLKTESELYRQDLAEFEREMAALALDPAAAGAPDLNPIERPTVKARAMAKDKGWPDPPAKDFMWEILDAKLVARKPGRVGEDPAFRLVFEYKPSVGDPGVGSLVRAAGDPIRPVAKGEPVKFAANPSDPKMLKLSKERLQLHPHRTKPANQATTSALKGNSEQLGEAAAAQFVEKRIAEISGAKNPKQLHPPPGAQAVSRSGEFDDVWSYEDASGQTCYLIVEAKGGTSILKPRKVANGRDAYQGTRQYRDEIVRLMKLRGGDDEKLANSLNNSLNVEYWMVKTPIAEGGGAPVTTITAQQFDMNPGTP